LDATRRAAVNGWPSSVGPPAGFPDGLEKRPLPAHTPIMDAVPDKTPPAWLAESLERSEAQIAAGQTVPLEPVLDRLRTSIARMKGKQQTPEPSAARKA
jgi:hypothetical protein